MSYYLLPRTPINIYKFIDYVECEDIPRPFISNSLSSYLYEIKHKIEEMEKDWNIFKKYTNPYEYINTNIPYKKKSISKTRHLSRSFYKMVEMLDVFDIQFQKDSIHTFHLAEGPGGFIEALVSKRNCKDDVYIGMTLLENDNDPNIPSWKQTEHFLKHNTNVYIESGIDKTGNILSFDNMTCVSLYPL